MTRPVDAAEPRRAPGGGAVFRALLRMEIRAGTQEDFERTWKDIAQSISREPGNLGQWLLREKGGAEVYYVLTEWADEESFRTFETGRPHVDNRRRLGEYRLAGSMETMTVVSRLPGCGP